MLLSHGIMSKRRSSSLLTGLVAGWKLDETSGTRYDSVGSSHLTDINTVTYSAGKTGNAALFTRTNAERLAVASNAALQMGDIDFAISFWMNVSGAATTAAGIINKWYDNSEREYCIYLGIAGARVSFIVRNAANSADVQLNEAGTVSASTWYHYVCYHDSVNNVLGIVRNAGTPTTVAHSGGVYNGAVNPRELAIGCDQDLPVPGNNNYFNGNIEDVYLWKRMLTTGEIAELYNSGNGITYPFA